MYARVRDESVLSCNHHVATAVTISSNSNAGDIVLVQLNGGLLEEIRLQDDKELARLFVGPSHTQQIQD